MSQLFSVPMSKLISNVLTLPTNPSYQAQMWEGESQFPAPGLPNPVIPSHANLHFPMSNRVIVMPSLPTLCLGRSLKKWKAL